MSEQNDTEDAVLTIGDKQFSINDVSFDVDDSEIEDIPHSEYMVGPCEFETTIETTLSFEDRDEYAQYLIDMGYTVVRETDGEIIAVADGIEVNSSE